jgi:hypothetical protein
MPDTFAMLLMLEKKRLDIIFTRIIKHYTDINPTVTTRSCVFCISNRLRKQRKTNVSKERLKIPDRYSEAVVLDIFTVFRLLTDFVCLYTYEF